nr:hypothetical protein [Bradyrhizobium sp. CCBAU 53338]
MSADVDHDRGGNGQPLRHMLAHPAEQGSDIARHAERGRQDVRIRRGLLVDHKQPCVGLSSVFRVNGTIERGRENDTPAFLKANEGISPCRIVRPEACAGDGDQTPTVAKARQGRSYVPKRRVGHSSIDICQRRERRVHQDDARYDTGFEVIIDLDGVEPGDLNAGKQTIEQCRTGFGQLVQYQAAAGELGEDGEQACPGGRLQNAVGGCNGRCGTCDQPQRDRRRELLKRLAILGTRHTTRDRCRRHLSYFAGTSDVRRSAKIPLIARRSQGSPKPRHAPTRG